MSIDHLWQLGKESLHQQCPLRLRAASEHRGQRPSEALAVEEEPFVSFSIFPDRIVVDCISPINWRSTIRHYARATPMNTPSTTTWPRWLGARLTTLCMTIPQGRSPRCAAHPQGISIERLVGGEDTQVLHGGQEHAKPLSDIISRQSRPAREGECIKSQQNFQVAEITTLGF